MRFYKIVLLLGLLWFLLLIGSMIVSGIVTIIADLNGAIKEITYEIKCYDRYSNEIKGKVCEEKTYCSEWPMTMWGRCEDEKGAKSRK